MATEVELQKQNDILTRIMAFQKTNMERYQLTKRLVKESTKRDYFRVGMGKVRENQKRKL